MPGVEHVLKGRDTDADWRELGASEPYYGVLSHPDFRTANLTPERLAAFYATGEVDVRHVANALRDLTGQPPAGRALDFGCGVGRLAEAMTAYASEVTGYDISPGMLEVARKRGGQARYVGEMPDGPFDWINSYIVFQHIPPERGEMILAELLTRLAPRGAVSLQFTVWREVDHDWTDGGVWWRKLFRRQLQRRWARRLPVGQILMYDYNLSNIVRLLNRAGVTEIRLVPTDHGGHHGVIIVGRRDAPAASG